MDRRCIFMSSKDWIVILAIIVLVGIAADRGVLSFDVGTMSMSVLQMDKATFIEKCQEQGKIDIAKIQIRPLESTDPASLKWYRTGSGTLYYASCENKFLSVYITILINPPVEPNPPSNIEQIRFFQYPDGARVQTSTQSYFLANGAITGEGGLYDPTPTPTPTALPTFTPTPTPTSTPQPQPTPDPTPVEKWIEDTIKEIQFQLKILTINIRGWFS